MYDFAKETPPDLEQLDARVQKITIRLEWGMGVTLDKYACDYNVWRDFAVVNCATAISLFETDDPFMWLVAATLPTNPQVIKQRS